MVVLREAPDFREERQVLDLVRRQILVGDPRPLVELVVIDSGSCGGLDLGRIASVTFSPLISSLG
jgi:hypothetical protein